MTLNRGSTTLRLHLAPSACVRGRHRRWSCRPSSLQHPQAGGRPPGAAAALIPRCSDCSPPRSPPPSSVRASTFDCHLLRCLCSPLCTSTRLHPALPTLRLLQRSSVLHSLSPQLRRPSTIVADRNRAAPPSLHHQGMNFHHHCLWSTA